jgi:four helix bundle protein
MNKTELSQRTKKFALRVMRLAEALPKGRSGNAIASQIVRSGTSVASNYRAALRGRSRAEFISKANVVLEEADETLLWLELVEEGGLLKPALISSLKKEADELVAIFTATLKSARGNKS